MSDLEAKVASSLFQQSVLLRLGKSSVEIIRWPSTGHVTVRSDSRLFSGEFDDGEFEVLQLTAGRIASRLRAWPCPPSSPSLDDLVRDQVGPAREALRQGVVGAVSFLADRFCHDWRRA